MNGFYRQFYYRELRNKITHIVWLFLYWAKNPLSLIHVVSILELVDTDQVDRAEKRNDVKLNFKSIKQIFKQDVWHQRIILFLAYVFERLKYQAIGLVRHLCIDKLSWKLIAFITKKNNKAVQL